MPVGAVVAAEDDAEEALTDTVLPLAAPLKPKDLFFALHCEPLLSVVRAGGSTSILSWSSNKKGNTLELKRRCNVAMDDVWNVVSVECGQRKS